MITDEERKAITELLQAKGFTAEQIETIMASREDKSDTWVSSEELWAALIERYGEPYKSKYAELQNRRKDSESQ